MILAIDPGTEESGWVLVNNKTNRIEASGVSDNHSVLSIVAASGRNGGWKNLEANFLVLEQIQSYGMPVGESTFETIFWTGRFAQANDGIYNRIPRPEIKAHLCGSAKAKDANVRQRLIDIWGPQGTKKKPGPTYGIKSHAWSALAVATVLLDRLRQKEKGVPPNNHPTLLSRSTP